MSFISATVEDAERLGGIPTLRVGTSSVGLVVWWVWLLVGCGQAQIEPLRVQPAPWANGERSIYQVIDLNGDFAGTATIEFSAGATQIEGDAWTMRREVAAQGDQEIVVVEMSATGLRPALSTLSRRLGANQRQQVKTIYHNGQVDLELTTAQNVTTNERINVPSDVRDQRMLLALVRALPLAAGYTTQVNSFLPIANLLERTTIRVVEEEQVQTPAGTYAAWRVKMSTTDSESQAWVAIGAPYMLVKFTDGRTGGTYELQEYQEGN